jgi:hypothetical protein
MMATPVGLGKPPCLWIVEPARLGIWQELLGYKKNVWRFKHHKYGINNQKRI